MEMVTGQGGVKSGRAVVGLDVVSHTLPRNYRTSAHRPCCQPIARPPQTCSDDPGTSPGCAGCQPDLCKGGPNLQCPGLTPYPAHIYPAVVTSGWGGGGVEGECAKCRLLAPSPWACQDPCCAAINATPLPCSWGHPRQHPSYQSNHRASQRDLQVPRASSVCVLPKLLSVEERLTTALGHPLDFQAQAHTNTDANTYTTTCQNYTTTTNPPSSKAQPHVQCNKTQAHPYTKTQGQNKPQTHPGSHSDNHHGKTHVHDIIHGHSHHNHKHSHSQGLAPTGSRLSRSVENLPRDIKEHILKCQCSCDHLGYGNYSATSLQHLPGMSNGCSSLSTKTNSSREDLSQEVSDMKHKHRAGLEVPAHVWGGVCLVLVLAGVAGVGVSVPLALRVDPNAGLHERLDTATRLLRDTPLVDGHNDLPWNIRKFMHNKLHSFNFTAELKKLRPWSRSSWSHTDLPRLKEGMVGAQFWVSYVPCESQRLNAVQLTIEQIDLIKRLIDQYPDDLRLVTSADDAEAAFKEGRIASLIGVEGGHAIQNSLGVLRALRDLGVRYMTLTHTCSTPWAECARARETDLEDPNSPRGLTHFGKTVVREMNRLGLMVDLSHVSQATMKAALEVSRAPVIFSHSSVYSICKNPRNVPDDILRRVAMNGGVVMVSFYNHFLTCSEHATVRDVVDHINHVRQIAGVQHVGIGADFDGVNKLPNGLEDVSRYPHLFAELLSDSSWSIEDLKMLAGQNLLRVMRDVEKVRVEMSKQRVAPYEEEVPPNQLKGLTGCSYKFTSDPDDS
ncbi:uncharacterized protein [Panulirus ornatus]|uniref:uncharacterized protein isoform X2 n=1 Tax=Panulirus ornatus TaxID=150431 RepID=UPI003A85B085